MAMPITFTTTLHQAPGMKATGIPVPDDVIAALGTAKKPAVTISIGDYTYRTTIGIMNGRSLAPFSSEHRAASGISAGDEIEVTIELDTAPRTVEVPEDLATALDAGGVRAAFDALSPSRQKAHVTSVEGTKNPETRARRVAAVVTALGAS
jgi:hypothetical protein